MYFFVEERKEAWVSLFLVFFAFHEYSRRRFSIFLKIDFSFTMLKRNKRKEAELTEEYLDLKMRLTLIFG